MFPNMFEPLLNSPQIKETLERVSTTAQAVINGIRDNRADLTIVKAQNDETTVVLKRILMRLESLEKIIATQSNSVFEPPVFKPPFIEPEKIEDEYHG